MQTRTSEPGEQDLGQERGTKAVLRLLFLPESASPGSWLAETLRAQCPPRRILYVWLMASGLWERALKIHGRASSGEGPWSSGP